MNTPLNAMQPSRDQMKGFANLDDDGPIVMVNLLKFKPDGGAAEYAKYSKAVMPLLERVGGRVLFSGTSRFCLIGNADWDAIALVEYPRKEALLEMIAMPEYQQAHVHREAGLEGQVNYAVAQNPPAGSSER